VTFWSWTYNLVPGDTNGWADIFVRDRQNGSTERVSVDSAGNQGNSGSYDPAISPDGRHVAFRSLASNLVPGDTNNSCDNDYDGVYAENCNDVFVHDRQTGATQLVSVDTTGNQGNRESGFPAVSSDGRYVAFESRASNLVPGDTNWCGAGGPGTCNDIFVYDRQTGNTERASVNSAGNEGNSASYIPDISADGRYVGFFSSASNLAPGGAAQEAYVRDRQTGTTVRVSVDSAGSEGNNSSAYPAISADGRYVTFLSFASNLVPADTNGVSDVFVRDVGDTDGDGEWDPFDPDPNDPDCDDDTFDDGIETYLGTDLLDACPDNSGDDAWPPDINIDTWANILDVLLYKPVIMTSVPPGPARFDLNADGDINILDVLLYKPIIMTQCMNP
jgi:Tol biopolymer transport system component